MSGPAAPGPSPKPTGTGQLCESTLDSVFGNTPRLNPSDDGSLDCNDHALKSPAVATNDASAQESLLPLESVRGQTSAGQLEDGSAGGGNGTPGKRNTDGNVMANWDQPASELLLASSEHSDTEFDANEFSLPITLARAGLQSSRTYDHSTSFRAQWSGVFQHSSPESPQKIRRVEKVIRARSHVLCHKCNTEFGLQELCKACGHTRCKECRKRPSHSHYKVGSSRRISQQFLEPPSTEVLPSSVRTIKSSPNLAQDARATFSLAELQPAVASSSIISRAETSRNTRSWLERLSPPPEADLESAPSRQRLRSPSPATSFNHIYEQIPASRPPLHTRKSSVADVDFGSMSSANSPPPLSPSPFPATNEDSNPSKFENPRVFRRTRHQVRFICEQCNTVFPTRREMNCPQCGHLRCDHCMRDP
jgi:hypothetical protein